MDKAEIIGQLQTKYNEIYPKYWQILMKKLEEPNNQQVLKMYDYLNFNIKYLETFMNIITIQDQEEMEDAIEKNNFIKQLLDNLYESKEQQETTYFNPKVEVVDK